MDIIKQLLQNWGGKTHRRRHQFYIYI